MVVPLPLLEPLPGGVGANAGLLISFRSRSGSVLVRVRCFFAGGGWSCAEDDIDIAGEADETPNGIIDAAGLLPVMKLGTPLENDPRSSFLPLILS